MKAIKIEWDVDYPEDLENLPTELNIPEGMTDIEDISDYLSDTTGFCHRGFVLTGCAEVVLEQLALIRISDDMVTLRAALNPDANNPIQGEEYDSRWSIPRGEITKRINKSGFWETWLEISNQISGGISLIDGLTHEGALNFMGYNDLETISCDAQEAAMLLGNLSDGEYLFNILPSEN